MKCIYIISMFLNFFLIEPDFGKYLIIYIQLILNNKLNQVSVLLHTVLVLKKIQMSQFFKHSE